MKKITKKMRSEKSRRIRDNTARYRQRLAKEGIKPLPINAFVLDHDDIRAYADALTQARREKMERAINDLIV